MKQAYDGIELEVFLTRAMIMEQSPEMTYGDR